MSSAKVPDGQSRLEVERWHACQDLALISSNLQSHLPNVFHTRRHNAPRRGGPTRISCLRPPIGDVVRRSYSVAARMDPRNSKPTVRNPEALHLDQLKSFKGQNGRKGFWKVECQTLIVHDPRRCNSTNVGEFQPTSAFFAAKPPISASPWVPSHPPSTESATRSLTGKDQAGKL